ncbi:hypothetical protein IC582_007624 [Cucumis melo]
MAIILVNEGVNAQLWGLLFMFLSFVSPLSFIVLSTIYSLARKALQLAKFCWSHYSTYH